MTRNAASPLSLSVRVDLPGGARFGPGMAALLEAIESTGSIRKAAAFLGMSYPKALKLIDAMHAAFGDRIVETRHGGANKGGAELTAAGSRILALYRQLVSQAETATQPALRGMSAMIRQTTG